MYRSALLASLLLLASPSITSPVVDRRDPGYISGYTKIDQRQGDQAVAQAFAALAATAAAKADASAAQVALLSSSSVAAAVAAADASAVQAAAVEASITSAAAVASAASQAAVAASLASVASVTSAAAVAAILSDTVEVNYDDPNYQVSAASAASVYQSSTASVAAYERLAGVTVTPSTTLCGTYTVDGVPTPVISCWGQNMKWHWGN